MVACWGPNDPISMNFFIPCLHSFRKFQQTELYPRSSTTTSLCFGGPSNYVYFGVPQGVRFWGFLLRNFPSSPQSPRCSVRWRRLARQLRRVRWARKPLGWKKPKGVSMSQSVSMIFLLRRKKTPQKGVFHRETDGIFLCWVIFFGG